MKTGKYYLSIAVVIGILCVPALGEVEQPSPGTLLGQPNPAIARIRQLYVIVLTHNAEPNKCGLVLEELEDSVADKLKEAGITVAETDIDKLEPNSPGMRMAKILRRRSENADIGNLKYINARIPELRVDVEVLDIKESQQAVLHARISLARLVYLGRQSQPNFKTDVWQSEPIMQAVSAENIPAAVTGAVLEQVEMFIHAYLAANPWNKQSTDANGVSEATEEQDDPVAESAPAEYEYVASKNSKVFHKPDCRWAKKIKPENLVSYSSRDEAIKAGKRPCRQCNP